MIWDNFKDKFHPSWHGKMKPFIESKECDAIYEFLKKEGKRGKKIAPISSLTYRCFLETPLDECKVVIMGLCPYHSAKNGILIADGLCMSCSISGSLQPSLEKFYEGLENELHNGMNINLKKSPDLSYLAKQGVLLFNAALTTEFGKAGSHLDIWEPFTKYVIEECIGYTGIPVIFLGKEAGKFQRYVTPFTHSFVLDHPAYAARTTADWETKGVFKKVNQIIRENNGKEFEIKWLEEIQEDCPF